nr:UDP-N-acetylmuramoyl-L-alanyl-D-glutamate--2,6-diaminopimelate ligase [Algihabitans albus]
MTEDERRAMGNTAERLEIAGLTADSRQVEAGFLFAALPGAQADGRDFIDQAVAKGAVAVLAPNGTQIKRYNPPVLLIQDAEPRRRLALMAATLHKRQPREIAAVTGTNGKTSVAVFVRQIWENLGRKAASLGTLGLTPPRSDAPAALTTPDPVELHRCLAALAAEGIEALAMEASSHGLDQFRLDGVRLSAAAFTNLSRDHLDYHGSMEAYLAAKARLFTALLPADGTAVLNADIPEFDHLRGLCDGRGQRILTYGRQARDLRLLALEALPAGLGLTLEFGGETHRLVVPLAGAFQAHNLLAALGLVLAGGAEPAAAIATLPRLTGVPGRVERVGATPAGGQVYVDYAHTPDALSVVLQAMRPHVAGKLWVVFGAGGDRDPGKRPLMGAAAAAHADRAVVTDDNPRGETPAAIRAQILPACPDATEIGDRREAIEFALARLEAGDVLVIAGKGHESGQIVGDRVLPFDDRDAARTAIATLAGGQV